MPLDGFVVVAGGELVVDGFGCVVGAVADGAGSKLASTQYECLASSIPQLAETEGFCYCVS